MKIEREINGKIEEIELTEDELYNAYDEQKFLFDKEDVEQQLADGYSDADLMEDYGLTRDEAEALLDDMAYRYRHIINKYGALREYALCTSVKEVLDEHSKKTAPAST